MDVSQILPNFFVGTFPKGSVDIDRLRQEGVTAVLNVQTDEDMAHWGVNWRRLEPYCREAGIEVRRVPVRDFDPDDLRRQLPKCIKDERAKPRRGDAGNLDGPGVVDHI